MQNFLAAVMMVFISGIIPAHQHASIFKTGDTVPDFTLQDQHGAQITLGNVFSGDGMNGAVLAFYVADNSPG